MEVIRDSILAIVLRSDVSTLTKLLQTTPELFGDCDPWRIKFNHDYSQHKFLDFWSSRDNYLIHHRGPMALSVTFGTFSNVLPVLFEHDEMMEVFKREYDSVMDWSEVNCIPHLVQLVPQKRFVIVGGGGLLVEQYDTDTEALKAIAGYLQKCRNLYRQKFVMIDLSYVTPYFWKQPCPETDSNQRFFMFYDHIDDLPEEI